MKRKKLAECCTEERLARFTEVVAKRHLDFTIVMENIADPHNISAVFRTCDAVGITEAFVVYDETQKPPKLNEKCSAGAKKWVDAVYYSDIEECYKELRRRGMKIYTTHLTTESVSLYDIDFTQPCAIVVGNEHRGVSRRAVELADANVLIPQVGMIESLNISVASAICLYEAFRQRLAAGRFDSPAFSEEATQGLLKNYLER